jgi:hypothetical protein
LEVGQERETVDEAEVEGTINEERNEENERKKRKL